jgi:hypothetical protein
MVEWALRISSSTFALMQDYLLFLLKEKVTKSSRQTRMLPRFAIPTHNNHEVLVTSIILFKVFLFSSSISVASQLGI